MDKKNLIDQVIQDIKDIKIQWATNIAKAAFETIIALSDKEVDYTSKDNYLSFIKDAMDKLIDARPTEPMLFNGMDYIKSESTKMDWDIPLEDAQKVIAEAAKFYLNLINETTFFM